MPSLRKLFLEHITQTSLSPLTVEVDNADGIYIYDIAGKKYIDLDSGFSVSSLGHRHPIIMKAIAEQCEKYLHTTVYGEHIQYPQVKFATLLFETLNNGLDSVYYTSGGSEAVEVALKLARRYTGRSEIISCRNAYHGSTIGAESLRSDKNNVSPYAPFIPGIRHINFNDEDALQMITEHTAAFILEPIQAEAGVVLPKNDYLQKVRARCNETGTLMILDEIQTGFGRTGSLFAFQQFNVVPDIFVIAKAMGGGMPIGAMVTNKEIASSLSHNPMLGHINTFGGHPLSAAAAYANLKFMIESDLLNQVHHKTKLFVDHLTHQSIREIRHCGLFMAIELENNVSVVNVIQNLLYHGVITDFFLFNNKSFRIAPPLIINEEEIYQACRIIQSVLEDAN